MQNSSSSSKQVLWNAILCPSNRGLRITTCFARQGHILSSVNSGFSRWIYVDFRRHYKIHKSYILSRSSLTFDTLKQQFSKKNVHRKSPKYTVENQTRAAISSQKSIKHHYHHHHHHRCFWNWYCYYHSPDEKIRYRFHNIETYLFLRLSALEESIIEIKIIDKY